MMILEFNDGTRIDVLESIGGKDRNREFNNFVRFSFNAVEVKYSDVKKMFETKDLSKLSVINEQYGCKTIYNGFTEVNSIEVHNNMYGVDIEVRISNTNSLVDTEPIEIVKL